MVIPSQNITESESKHIDKMASQMTVTVSSLANDLLVHMDSFPEVNVNLYKTLTEIGNIMQAGTTLYEKETKIIAVLGTMYDQCNIPPESDSKRASGEEAFNLCCYCNNKLASLPDLARYTNAKELSFSIAGFHNRNTQSAVLCQQYAGLVRNHTVLMMNAALYYMEIRYWALNSPARVDEDILSVLLLDNRYMYDRLLPRFRKSTSWSKFQFFLYGKCLGRDLAKRHFYDPENYMEPTFRALNRKDTAHNVMEMLAIALRGLDCDEFIAKYLRRFLNNYKARFPEEASTVYNYNLPHYLLPSIIHAYPAKAGVLIAALSDGRPFFEDLFLVASTIASRKKLIAVDWCLDDLVYHTLHVSQAWIVEQTIIALVNNAADSKNIHICFALLKKFMTGATYDRLRSVHFLNILKIFLVHVKSFASKNSRHKDKDRLQDVSDFTTFLLEFAKARFRVAEESHKQYYYEIFQDTRQTLPNFFHEIPAAANEELSTKLKCCAALSAVHFMQMLKRCEDATLCIEEINCYLRSLLDHSQFHHIEHGLTANISNYSHRLIHSSNPFELHSLSVTLAAYRELIDTHTLPVRRVQARTIERIILDIIPRQTENDPNIFVNMEAALERAVKEGVRIMSHMIVYDRDQCTNYECNVFDFLYLCVHILEYAPSKRLVFDVSRLHRAALKEQAMKNPQGFLCYSMENISQITGNTLVARRAMRRHPSITETMRNILIATVDYEACTGKNHHVTIQNELLNYVKTTKNKDDVHFVLATEAQKVIFDTKEFAFKKIIRIDELVMHILHSLDSVSKWEALTALIQLLQTILSALSGRADSFLFRQYFGLVVDIMTMVPSRTVTAVAGLCVLHILNFRNIPPALRNTLPKARYTPQMLNCNMFVKVLYESTICGCISPYMAPMNLANDINAETKLRRFNDETCMGVVAVIENVHKDLFRN